jgi:hypothetical protein
MIIGAVLGWIMIITSRQQPVRLGMVRPAVRDLPIGIAVGALVAYPGRWLAEVGFAGALVGAVGAAAACVLIFGALVWLLDRRSVTGLLDLWRSRTPADRSPDGSTER